MLGTDRLGRDMFSRIVYAARISLTIGILGIVLSFTLAGVHAHDVGTVLDGEGVAIRAGHHCAQPLMERYGVAATARASLGVYNDKNDLDRLAQALRKAVELFG